MTMAIVFLLAVIAFQMFRLMILEADNYYLDKALKVAMGELMDRDSKLIEKILEEDVK